MSPAEETEYLPLVRTLLPELVRESPGSRVRLMDLFTELFHVAEAAGKPFMPLGLFVRCMRALGFPRATATGKSPSPALTGLMPPWPTKLHLTALRASAPIKEHTTND